MRCLLCLNLSWKLLCKNCLNSSLTPNPSKRALESGLVVYSAYKYKEIKELLHTKHTFHGAKIYSQLTKHALLPLVESFTCGDVFSLSIDDHTRSGYSHSAVIARELRVCLKPLYGRLRAKNLQRYSGQSLHVREKNRRNFTLTCKEGLDIVLIDDIVTTGSTLSEATTICKYNNLNTLFAITLADARD
jgi:competence protein ComFC